MFHCILSYQGEEPYKNRTCSTQYCANTEQHCLYLTNKEIHMKEDLPIWWRTRGSIILAIWVLSLAIWVGFTFLPMSPPRHKQMHNQWSNLHTRQIFVLFLSTLFTTFFLWTSPFILDKTSKYCCFTTHYQCQIKGEGGIKCVSLANFSYLNEEVSMLKQHLFPKHSNIL